MDGVVNVLKPAGMTSHDVVARLRKIYHTKKVGHTGTLDPDAIGVLPVCIGQGTRLVEYLMEKTKVYRVILQFGQETDTQDSSGQVTEETAPCLLSREAFAEVLQGFVGEISQIPPMYSALKKDGQPLYKLARQGIEVAREPRLITIHRIDLLMYNQDSAMLDVTCSKGTYIRTLCEDIGRACQSSAHMTFLMRTASGGFKIENSITLERLAETEQPETLLMPLAEAVAEMPIVLVDDANVKMRLNNGLEQRLEALTGIENSEAYKAMDSQGHLLAIGVVENGYFKPNKVFRFGE